MTLYLLSYNNYYNRRLLYLRELEEYTLEGTFLYQQNGVNFNPNDGVSTSIIVNHAGDAEPDYCLVVDDANEIVSRWYVIDTKRLREGQYKHDLYRDVLADYSVELMTTPMFVEKSKVSVGNPLIYNSENMTYNQIKQAEYPLKDNSETPWLVGYVDRTYATGDNPITIPADDLIISYELTSLDQYQYNQYTIENFVGNYSTASANYRINFDLNGKGGIWTAHMVFNEYCLPSQSIGGKNTYYPYGEGWESTPGQSTSGYYWGDSAEAWINKLPQVYSLIHGVELPSLNAYVPCHTRNETDRFLEEKGKIIKVDDKYYSIDISQERKVAKYAIPMSSELGQTLRDIVNIFGASISRDRYTQPVYECQVEYFEYKVVYIDTTPNQLKLYIPQDRLHLSDAPYDMFCMPLNSISIEGVDDDYSVDYLRFAYAIALELTQAHLYDFQLLPYCPLPPSVVLYNSIEPGNHYRNSVDYNRAVNYIVDDNDIKYGAIFWCEQSSFEVSLNWVNVSVPTDAIEFKIENECSFYRICSPNYNGVFEISATKNNGLADFKAYCTYKPFQPYIKIAPAFNGLYGSSFGDARGLICGGDFSLPIITDSWKQYQVQNKNYQVMFDRQIENMEVNNSLARTQEIIGAATGTVAGAVSGGMAGGMMGGPWGAAAGAVVGSVSAGIGGIADVAIADRMRAENMDYTKDMYGYQLGNIKALPQSLTKVSAYNIDNKLFPFVEFYTATATEKQALRNKLKYNGMTVMAIGTLADYFYRENANEEIYFKAKLIRFPKKEIDYHMARVIADELYKGVFI